MSEWEVGSRVGPYVLIARVGAGGMGDVWKARDTRLDRLVAIKRLREPTATFEREARTIASLNHPNICTLHDIGADYLVMEYIEGTPLTGPVDAAEVLRLAIQVVAALEAAHDRGIVHRDLKPANVLVSRGRAKLLDFGIARLRPASTRDATVTGDGQLTGTPAYMSPEQAQGLPTDARSDIFSFGAMFYEVLSGRRAFEGSSPLATITAVLRDDPKPLQMPGPLPRIVQRCLEKSRDRRYQTAAELRAAIEVLTAPAETPPSIAVLPFANMSPDPEHEYFSDGLTEEIINALAHVPGLKVIARTSAFAFKDQNLPIGRIAEALGVGSILEGSVRRAGNRIRVTAQLVQASDGCHLWSERYDRDLSDVFAVQDDIASAIVQELRGKLAAAPATPREYTPKLPAYEAFLMGRHHVWRHTAQSWEQGRRCYEEAVALDPRYALPYVGIAKLLHIQASGRGPDAQQAAAGIRPMLEQALARDPSLPEAHAWAGILASTYDHDWAAAERRFARAMAAEPVPPRTRHLNAYFRLRLVGRADEAVEEHHRALEHDPLSLITRVGLVMSLMSAGRDADASSEAHRLLDLAPDFAPSYCLLTLNVAREPLDVALAFAEHLHEHVPLGPMVAGTVGLLAGLLRRNGDEARAAELLRTVADPRVYGNPVDLALYHLASGETDCAFDFMEMLVLQRHPLLMMVVVGGPYGAVLRSSPRWPGFARQVGLPG